MDESKMTKLIEETNTRNIIENRNRLTEETPPEEEDSLNPAPFNLTTDKMMESVRLTGEGYWKRRTRMKTVLHR